jgi:hypothetical protein
MTAYALEETETSAQKSSVGSVVLYYLRALVAARDCAAAIELGRKPSDEALRTLGIDPARFAEVKLF